MGGSLSLSQGLRTPTVFPLHYCLSIKAFLALLKILYPQMKTKNLQQAEISLKRQITNTAFHHFTFCLSSNQGASVPWTLLPQYIKASQHNKITPYFLHKSLCYFVEFLPSTGKFASVFSTFAYLDFTYIYILWLIPLLLNVIAFYASTHIFLLKALILLSSF